jgi:hypothetical protein
MMHFQLKPLTLALSLALAMPLAGQAADHSLTGVSSHNAQSGVSTLNFVMSLNWNLANPPTKGRDKTYVRDVLKQFARSLYTMTEGKHQIGTVYVYDKSQFLKRADIQFLDREGRAQANTSGWKQRSSEIEIFTVYKSTAETTAEIGKTLAHEMGHYGYGLLDEYDDEDKKSSKDLGNPLAGDTPRNTIMNEHLKFVTLSTSSDYADASMQKTAQWRVYQRSAWETMIQNPENDSETAGGYGGPIRTWFEAFKNLSPPTADSLKKPSGGDEQLQVVYMNEGSLMVLVINQNLTLAQLKAAKQAAKGAVDALNDKAQVAVLAYPDFVATPVQVLTAVGDNRKDIQTAIDDIPQSADNNSPDRALNAALTLIKNAVNPATTASVLLLSTSTAVDATTVQNYGKESVAINPVVISTGPDRQAQRLAARTQAAGGNKVLLGALAEQTGGRYAVANDDSEVAQAASQIVDAAEGEALAIINDDGVDQITPGEPFTLTTLIGTADQGASLEFAAYWDPEDQVDFSLQTPGGQLITPDRLPAEVRYQRNADGTGATYAVSSPFAGRAGLWLSKVTARQTTADGVFQDVTAIPSVLGADIATTGGSKEDPRPMHAEISVDGPLPVIQATVRLEIYDEDGQPLQTDLVARDDGIVPDVSANDGVYTVKVADFLKPDREYELVARVSNPNNAAQFSTSGRKVQGTDAPPVPVGPFQRTASVWVMKETAPQPEPTPLTGGGGGCVLTPNAPFDPLFPAISLGAFWYLIRRRRSR